MVKLPRACVKRNTRPAFRCCFRQKELPLSGGDNQMTHDERVLILQLRVNGLGYKRIATELGLSLNTVQSYCRRHPTEMKAPERLPENGCLCCGARLHHTPDAKKRKFCSDRCRITLWNAHPEAGGKRKVREIACGYCGATYFVIGEQTRMYCSRICSDRARAKLARREGSDG